MTNHTYARFLQNRYPHSNFVNDYSTEYYSKNDNLNDNFSFAVVQTDCAQTVSSGSDQTFYIQNYVGLAPKNLFIVYNNIKTMENEVVADKKSLINAY